MFRKLRLKLMLINLSVIVLLFLFLITGTYFFVQNRMIDGEAHLMVAGIVCLILLLFGSLFIANKAMVPIQQSWQQQKDFLADASYQFRTPLAIILTNLEIIRANSDEIALSQAHWLNTIYEETLGMTKLVESLLFLARVDSHQQLLTKDTFPLSQTITLVTELFRPIAALQEVSIDSQVEDDIFYYGDESKIRQLLSILFEHALRHTPTNGKITLTLEKSKQNIVLSVSDTGKGMATEYIEKFFERFYHADTSRTKSGTGLELPIAKWIAESHNGNIRVVSSPGNGMTFTVTLPCT